MEEKFQIPVENVHSAFYHLLIEIHSQNKVMVDMLLPMYAKSENVDIEDVKATFQKHFLRKKAEIQSHIHVHFGNISLNDILGDEKI